MRPVQLINRLLGQTDLLIESELDPDFIYHDKILYARVYLEPDYKVIAYREFDWQTSSRTLFLGASILVTK